MTVLQFVIGYGFTTIGYPLGVTLIQTIFSKVLGPRPQGVWMGLMTGAGCASRVLGPVFVGVIYTRFGIYHTFGITGATLLFSMLVMVLVHERLVPPAAKGLDEGADRAQEELRPLDTSRSSETRVGINAGEEARSEETDRLQETV